MQLFEAYLKLQKPLPRLLSTATPKMVRFLTQAEATNIDAELFSEHQFAEVQLMELAGLSCAAAIARAYPAPLPRPVLVCCGPGNNGGDGLVLARHLRLFGYEPRVAYPKRTDKPLYSALAHQCAAAGVAFVEAPPDGGALDAYALVVDALFGFGFRPPVRPQFAPLLAAMRATRTPIASVDVPSGWDVEGGPPAGGIEPEVLISLTAPKLCAKFFTGKHHYLGGRFVPPALAEKYALELPVYPGSDCFVELK